MQIAFLKEASEFIQNEKKIMWIIVLDHKGSSPGKRGFHMFVSATRMKGTIGGGMMEYKLVQWARSQLQVSSFVPQIKLQIHSAEASKDRSGMICSGEQVIAMYLLTSVECKILEENVSRYRYLIASHEGFTFQDLEPLDNFINHAQSEWYASFSIQNKDRIYVIGAGHVGLAVCKLLAHLEVDVILLDDRPELNTLEVSPHVTQKIITPYHEISPFIAEGPESYIVVCTFGFRTDKIVIRQLVGKTYAFFGVLGSQSKINTLWQELKEEGISEQVLASIHAPIGVNQHGTTAMEIAFSIVMQIITVRYKPN